MFSPRERKKSGMRDPTLSPGMKFKAQQRPATLPENSLVPMPTATTSTTMQQLGSKPHLMAHPKGLVDSLSQFFTPSNKRTSRVSLNAHLIDAKPLVNTKAVKSSKKRIRKKPLTCIVQQNKEIQRINRETHHQKRSSAGLQDGLSHIFSAEGVRKRNIPLYYALHRQYFPKAHLSSKNNLSTSEAKLQGIDKPSEKEIMKNVDQLKAIDSSFTTKKNPVTTSETVAPCKSSRMSILDEVAADDIPTKPVINIDENNVSSYNDDNGVDLSLKIDSSKSDSHTESQQLATQYVSKCISINKDTVSPNSACIATTRKHTRWKISGRLKMKTSSWKQAKMRRCRGNSRAGWLRQVGGCLRGTAGKQAMKGFTRLRACGLCVQVGVADWHIPLSPPHPCSVPSILHQDGRHQLAAILYFHAHFSACSALRSICTNQ